MSAKEGSTMHRNISGFIVSAVLVGLASLLGAERALAAPACDPAVVADVAAQVEAACPCAGKTSPSGEVTAWKNHGQYVSCVTRERNRLAKQLGLSKSCVRQTTRCAARSTCGKREGFVTCRTPDLCSDVNPDGIAEGTCSDDPAIACDTAADCPVLRCTIKSAADLCTAQGGIAGSGSCCD
jgi:hypothetical protein